MIAQMATFSGKSYTLSIDRSVKHSEFLARMTPEGTKWHINQMGIHFLILLIKLKRFTFFPSCDLQSDGMKWNETSVQCVTMNKWRTHFEALYKSSRRSKRIQKKTIILILSSILNRFKIDFNFICTKTLFKSKRNLIILLKWHIHLRIVQIIWSKLKAVVVNFRNHWFTICLIFHRNLAPKRALNLKHRSLLGKQ